VRIPKQLDPDLKPAAPKLQLTPKQIEQFDSQLNSYHAIYSPLFYRKEQQYWALKCLQGHFLNLARKTTEPIALNIEDGNVRQMQHFKGAGMWDDEPIIQRHQGLVAEELGSDDGAILIDESDFPKSGEYSVGVARQHCGILGKVANCQAGVFAAYLSEKGYALIDRRLYMPKQWFTKKFVPKRERCGVPEDLTFEKKTELAWDMFKAIIDHKAIPFRWVLCDDDYGKAPWLLDKIAENNKLYFADVPENTRVFVARGLFNPKDKRASELESKPRTVAAIVKKLGRKRWFKATVKEGSKGPIVAEFACFRAFNVRNKLPGSEIEVIIRRPLDDAKPKDKYFLSNAPATTSSQTFVRLSGMRWPIETIFEEEKDHLGMDHYELRSWIGWHHHMTLAMLAHYFLIRLKNTLKDEAPALTLPQARLLLSAVLPQRKLDAETALEIVQYYQERNHAATISHRKATLRRHRARRRRPKKSS
jgi:SRSO17 transposase